MHWCKALLSKKPRYTFPNVLSVSANSSNAACDAIQYLCCSLHNCLTLFAGNIVRNLSSIPPAQHHGLCITKVRLWPDSYRRLSNAKHTTHLLCIIRSSSSLTFETTNLKKPANNEHCDVKRPKRTSVS